MCKNVRNRSYSNRKIETEECIKSKGPCVPLYELELPLISVEFEVAVSGMRCVQNMKSLPSMRLCRLMRIVRVAIRDVA